MDESHSGFSETGSSETGPFAVLGLSPADAELYRVVLRHAGAQVDDLAGVLGVGADEVVRRLSGLVDLGLVGLNAGTVHAPPPEEGLGGLVARRMREMRTQIDRLDGVRGQLPALEAEYARSRRPGEEPLAGAVLEGGDVVGLMRGLALQARGDVLWLRPDQWRRPTGAELDDVVAQVTRQGRRSRALYPARVLEDAPEVLHTRAAAGEDVRVTAEVPTRLVVLGDAAAVLPAAWGVNDDRRVLVRERVLLSALRELFERMWARAMPVPGIEGRGTGRGLSATPRRALLLEQLAAGARDEQIARALGISLRTVRRRVAAVLDELGSESRFQAGVEAVRRGWL